MNITVAICTWNRCRLLARTLESLSRLQLDGIEDWEILVVDNGSTDDTPRIVESFGRDLPLRYLFQPVSGHTRCRNVAIEQAQGELMVWTDDDVELDRACLTAYASAARRYPLAQFFGGPIEPEFLGEQPQWLKETWLKCKAAFAACDRGDSETAIPPARFPYGANFAVRTVTQKKFPFDVTLGRQANQMLGEDEIDLMQRMVQAGHAGVWLPQARLRHLIPLERATPAYVGRYFAGQGMANAMNGRPTFRSRVHALGVAIHNRLCYVLKRHRRGADEWVSHLIRSSIAWGEFLAWNRVRKRTGVTIRSEAELK